MKTNALAKMLGVDYHHGMTLKEAKRKSVNKVDLLLKDKVKRIRSRSPLAEEMPEYLEVMKKIKSYDIAFCETNGESFQDYILNRKTRKASIHDFSDDEIIQFIRQVWK